MNKRIISMGKNFFLIFILLTLLCNPTTALEAYKASPQYTQPAGRLFYELKAINQPNNPSVDNVVLTDKIPHQDLTFIPYDSNHPEGTSDPACTLTADTVNCEVGSLIPGAVKEYFIAFDVSSNIPCETVITNNATISTTTTGISLIHSDNVNTEVLCAADLGLKKFTSSQYPYITSLIDIGSEFNYYLDVKNFDVDSSATGVTITDTLPPAISYVSSNNDLCTYSTSEHKVTCGPLTLSATGSTRITLTVQAPTDTSYCWDYINNTGSVASDETDVNPANDQDTTRIQIDCPVDEPDLSIQKFTSAQYPSVMSLIDLDTEFNYYLDVKNANDFPADDIIVFDKLPGDLEFISVNKAYCSYVSADHELVCGPFSLGAGADTRISVAMRTPASDSFCFRQINNTANVTNPDVDTRPGNNDDFTTIQIDCPVDEPDLSIQKFTSAQYPSVMSLIDLDTEFNYYLDVKNANDFPADDVIVVDELPDDLAFVSVNDASCNYDAPSHTLTCGPFSLAGGDDKRITLTMRTPSEANYCGQYRNNSANVSNNDIDTRPGNNQDDTLIMIDCDMADLEVTKEASVQSAYLGGRINYDLTATNKGPRHASGVTLVDFLPDYVSFVSAPSCTYNDTLREVKCTPGSLNVRETQSYTITVDVTSDPQDVCQNQTLVNIVTISGNEADLIVNNNAANAYVNVSCIDLTPPEPEIRYNPDGTIILSWQAIPGADTYTIYGVNTCTGLTGPYTILASGLSNTNWTDMHASSYQQRYYKVAAVTTGSTEISTYAVGKYDVVLQSGWNLASIPLRPTYTSVKPFANSIFASLHDPLDVDFGPGFSGSYDFVVGPNTPGSTAIGSFDPSIPSAIPQNLQAITEEVSFNILMNRDDNLTVVGRVPDSSTINLPAGGWFWIGYPSCQRRDIKPYSSSVLSSLHDGSATDFGPGFDGNYDFLIGPFNGLMFLGTFDPMKPSNLPQNLESMGPGRGYIMSVTNPDEFTVNYA